MGRKFILLTGVLLIVLISFPVCSKKSSNPAGPSIDNSALTGDITTSPKETVASQSVGAAGGTVKVAKSGDPLDGLEITVPQGALSDTKSITVSEAKIVDQKLGVNFNPISPIITVQNVSGYASDAITVKVPVTVPTGHIAIGALYNEKTGDIECLPLVDQSSSSVTVATRTFVPSPSASTKKGIFKSLKAEDALSMGNLLILSVPESIIKGQAIINTGFQPGVDDWEFVNRGSYIAPGGNCAGQSVSAMWYYYEKKLRGASSLYHQFDKVLNSNDPARFEDNTRGYRFANTIQNDIDWNALIRKLFVTMRSNSQYNSLSWKCFALSMFLTGEPQYVGLEGDIGAHAIIAYKIDYTNGILYVADPNYPGQERTIKYDGSKFQPFSTKLNADDPNSHQFDKIGYFAKSTFVDWDRIGSRWSEFENLTIGNDRFRKYRLWVFDSAAGQKLDTGYTAFTDSIITQVQWENGTNDNKIALSVYDDKGNRIMPDIKYSGATAPRAVKLKSGENILGFQISATVALNDTTNINKWLDFQWIVVNYTSLKIDPESLPGKKNVSYTFNAIVEGKAPESAKYLWNFGDGTPEVSLLNTKTVTHTFTADGVYNVSLKLYDVKSKETLLTTATATASIASALAEVSGTLSFKDQYGFSSTGTWKLTGATVKSWYTDDPQTLPILSVKKGQSAVLTITATTPMALEVVRNDYTPADSAYSITTTRRKLVGFNNPNCTILTKEGTFPISTSSNETGLTAQFTFNGNDDTFSLDVVFEVRQDIEEWSKKEQDKGALVYSSLDKFIKRWNVFHIYVKQWGV